MRAHIIFRVVAPALAAGALASLSLAACASRAASGNAAPAASWDSSRAQASAEIRARYRELADAIRKKNVAAVKSFYSSAPGGAAITARYRSMLVDPQMEHIDRFDIDIECIELRGPLRDTAVVVYTETSQARWTRARVQHHRDATALERAHWIHGADAWHAISSERVPGSARVVVDGNEIAPKDSASATLGTPAAPSCREP